jgi:hypothetical protein
MTGHHVEIGDKFPIRDIALSIQAHGCGDRSAGPMTIATAKKMALAMALDPGIGKRLLDPIGNLNKLQAWLLDANLENWEARST